MRLLTVTTASSVRVGDTIFIESEPIDPILEGGPQGRTVAELDPGLDEVLITLDDGQSVSVPLSYPLILSGAALAPFATS